MGPTNLNIKVFADGANIKDMVRLYNEGVDGFTTNPTLANKAGVKDFTGFCKEVLEVIRDRPVSFEVFSDEFKEMGRQARTISSWGDNVYVKIPVTNTKGESSAPLIRELSQEGLKLNVTAILTLNQVVTVSEALSKETPSVVSVFAGRIADTGVDPMPIMRGAVDIMKVNPKAEVLWASTREALNIVQAKECGCHIITVTPDIMKKMSMFGKDLKELSRETVVMFYNDARAAGYTL